MKKIFILIATITFISFPITFNSCEKEEDNSLYCDPVSRSVYYFGIAYTLDPSSENCINYKHALKDYLDHDCDNLDDDEFKTIMDSLPC